MILLVAFAILFSFTAHALAMGAETPLQENCKMMAKCGICMTPINSTPCQLTVLLPSLDYLQETSDYFPPTLRESLYHPPR